MTGKTTRNAALFLLLWAVTVAAWAAPTTGAYPTGGETIKLDGQLSEAAWAQAPWATGFVSAASSKAAGGGSQVMAVQTRFKALYDSGALYVAVECDEPNLDRLKANVTDHDGLVYSDDCVELFLDPAGEGRYYHHFIINPKGAWYDAYAADYGLVQGKAYDCPLQVGAAIDPAAKQWRVEVKIPFAGLNLNTDAGGNWLWNVSRERYAGVSELSSWSPLVRSFHSPKEWGKLTGVKVDFRQFAFTVAEPQVVISGGGSGVSDLGLSLTLTNQSPQGRRLILGAQVFGQPGQGVQAEPVQLASGARADISLPTLGVRGNLKQARVQFTVTDADSGQPLRIAVKSLSAEYQPIRVEVLQPVYRQNIYATGKLPEIIFKVTLAPDVIGLTKTVEAGLLDESGAVVRSGKCPVADLTRAQKLEAAKLPVGTYKLQVRAVGQGGKTLASLTTVLRKLAPATGTEVRVDEKRNIVVNGQPQVFIGWYGGVPTEDPRAEVVALQNITTPQVLVGLDLKGCREAWEKHHIYSVVSIECGRLFDTFKLWQKPGNTVRSESAKLPAPSEECVGYLKQIVDLVGKEPWLVGYYIADEPEINNTRSDYLEATYRLMQELDPYHPVMVTNDTLDGIVTHGYKCADILNPDPYGNNYDYVPNFLRKVLEVGSRGKATMATLWHAAGQTHFVQDWGSAPAYPYRMMRSQYLAAVALGSRGFTAYTSTFYMPEPILRYGCPPIWREVRFLEPALANPAPAPKVEADAEMTAWLGQANGYLYLIAANHKPGARTARVSHPLLAKIAGLDVVAEDRTVKVSGGAFSDRFADGDVHVYTTDPAGRKLMTTAAVEKLIADQVAATHKPGNLLHIDGGVLVKASEGFYAPWFDQYFYYALNGITDDTGWYLSHAGDKPGWLELTLPAPKNIARVVLYTPNVADYDLQFTGPDGVTRLAEMRGNQAEVSEVNLQPAAPTLKLRITVRAVRPGSAIPRGMVREIEAYEQPGTGAVTPLRTLESTTTAPTYVPPATETTGPLALWREEFANFVPAEKFNWDGKDDKWVFNPQLLSVKPRAGGGADVATTAPAGYSSMAHFFPYNKEYRYFQVKIGTIDGPGYRWASVFFGDSSGKPGFRSAVHSLRPGLYTVDTWYVNDSYHQGAAKQAYVSVFAPGSAKQPDGTVKMGPVFGYDYLQLVRRPVDGLVVTLADGSPLGDTVKQGDQLMFRVLLDKPALDVSVEALTSHTYNVLSINGEPAVQLQKTGARDGREWAAVVQIGPKTGKYDGRKGYPVCFRAQIVGGALKETLSTMALAFE